jgi:hypothetical protein
MIATKDILAWLKTIIDSPSWTTGKLDTTKDKTICVYGSNINSPVRTVVGGGADGYYTRRIQLVVRWTTSCGEAEAKALSVYELTRNTDTTILAKRVWSRAIHSEPTSLGTDDKGVYEYSIILNLICER